jgi:hypothetical protein
MGVRVGRNVAGLIPDGVIDIFHLHNTSGRTMALGMTEPPLEYQEYILGCKAARCVKLTTLPPTCASCLEICKSHPPRNLRACPGM